MVQPILMNLRRWMGLFKSFQLGKYIIFTGFLLVTIGYTFKLSVNKGKRYCLFEVKKNLVGKQYGTKSNIRSSIMCTTDVQLYCIVAVI